MRLLYPTVLAATLLTALPASAQRLPTIVRPLHYDLAFVVDLAHERFDGTETIRVQVAEPTSHPSRRTTPPQWGTARSRPETTFGSNPSPPIVAFAFTLTPAPRIVFS